MNLISVKEAVSHIKQACEPADMNSRLPYFFLVGAGISCPSIPPAAEIEDHCKKVALNYGRKDMPDSNQRIDTYSHWFERAYPHTIERQEYLRCLIEGKPISHANLRLAHLLSEKKVASLVITTNFDDFLSRSLTLFGYPHIVCDHPKTVGRIDPEGHDLQIVHVHGSYWFYDCCNLRGEIEDRAQPSSDTILTMGNLLDHILFQRSPIVIGYGGWDDDVIMTALKHRLRSGALAYNLYWF